MYYCFILFFKKLGKISAYIIDIISENLTNRASAGSLARLKFFFFFGFNLRNGKY